LRLVRSLGGDADDASARAVDVGDQEEGDGDDEGQNEEQEVPIFGAASSVANETVGEYG
jgi:hypothetical protein